MASKTFEVTVTGLDELRAKLQTRRIFGPVKQEIIQRAAKEGQETAEAESKGRFGTKGFKGRMNTTFEQDGLVARVQPHAQIRGIAGVIEVGRQPGRRPPPRKALLPWAGRAGIMDIKELQERIHSGGTRGVGFMDAGAKAADKAIDSGIPRAEREIERGFNA